MWYYYVPSVALGLLSLFFASSYVRELVVFFLRRQDYDKMKKPEIRTGELDTGPQVSTKDRLLFSYPFLIVMTAFGAFVSRPH